MSMERHIHLLSNAQPELFPNNRANDFVNAMNPPLCFKANESWEVAATEFSCVNTLQTIPEDLSLTKTTSSTQKIKAEGDFPGDLTFLDTDFAEGEITHYCYPYNDERFVPSGTSIWSSNIDAYMKRIHKVFDYLTASDSALEESIKKKAPLVDGRYDMYSTKDIKTLYDSKQSGFSFWMDLEMASTTKQVSTRYCTSPTPMLRRFFYYLLLSSKTSRQYLTFQPHPKWDILKNQKQNSVWYMYPITQMRNQTFQKSMLQRVYGSETLNPHGLAIFYSAPLQAILKFSDIKSSASFTDHAFEVMADKTKKQLATTDAYLTHVLSGSHHDGKYETVLSKYDPSQFYYVAAPFHRVKKKILTLSATSLGDLLTKMQPHCPGSTITTTSDSVSLRLPIYGEVLGVCLGLSKGTKIRVTVNSDIIMNVPKGATAVNRTLLDAAHADYGATFGPGSTCTGMKTASAPASINVILFFNQLLPIKRLPILLPKAVPHTSISRTIIPKGVYTADDLIKTLNSNSDGYSFKAAKGSSTTNTVHVQVTLDSNTTLEIESLLADILSLPSKITTTETGELPVNLKVFSYNVLIYCSFIQECIVGGQREKVLRVVPFNSDKYLSLHTQEFITPQYYPVSQLDLDRLHIKLMTDYGEPFPISQGRCYIKLHFRRIR